MKRITLLIFASLIYFIGAGQKLQYDNTYGRQFQRVVGDSLVGLPTDTFTVPSALRNIPFISFKSGTMYRWDPIALRWVILVTPSGGTTGTCTERISGGEVVYTGTGLTFYITPAVYRIDCIEYTSDSLSVTLDPADATFDRFDRFYLDSTGAHVLTGTPAESPIIPQLPNSSIDLTSVQIDAGATTPDLVTSIVYDENTESVVTNFGTTTNGAQTAVVYKGTYAMENTNIINGEYVDFTKTSGTWDITNVDVLSFFARIKVQMGQLSWVRVSLWNGTSQVSNEVLVGWDKNAVNQWQGMSIPLTAFHPVTNNLITKVRFRYTSNTAANYTGFFLDYIHFVDGLFQSDPGTDLSLTLNMPAAFTVAPFNTIANNGTWNVTMAGTTGQYLRGNGTLATKDWITKIGAIDNYSRVPNGLRISGDTLYGQTADTTNKGFLDDYDWRRFDSTARMTVENVGDGDSIMVNLDAFRTAFKTLVAGTGVTFDISDTTIKVNSSGGGSVNAIDGLSLDGSDISFGGPLGTASPLLTNRQVDLNDKLLYFTRGVPTPDYTAFDDRYTPFNVHIVDSVTSDAPNFDVVPKSGGNFHRTIKYYPPGYKVFNRYGWRMALETQVGDSVIEPSVGGDYYAALIAEHQISPLTGHTGRSVVRSGHGGFSYNFAHEGIPTLLANIFFDSTDATRYIYYKGFLTGVRPYLVMANGATDTVENISYYAASSFVNTPSWVKRSYVLRPEATHNRSAQPFFLYDSTRRERSFHAGNFALGPGVDSSDYKLDVRGTGRFSDSLTLSFATNTADTTGYDVVLRRRSDGTITRVSASQLLAFGGSGGSGPLRMGVVGTTPNDSAGYISNDTLYLQPASEDYPGLVSTSSQTFGGSKSFSGSVGFSNLVTYNASSLWQEQTIVATPAAGYGYLWNNGGKPYWKDDAGVEYDLTDGGGGGTSVSLAKGFTADTMTVASAKTIIPRHLWNETFAGGSSVTVGSPFMMELVSGAGADAHISANAHTISGATGYGYGVVESGTTTTGKAVLQSAYNVTNQNFLGKIDNDYYYRVSYKNVIFNDLSDGTETYKATIGFAIDNAVTSSVVVTYTHSENSGAFVCTSHVSNTPENTNTAVTVAADTEYDIDIEIYNQVCKFWINGTLVATHSTSVPAAAASVYGPMLRILKSAGSTNRQIYVDDVTLRIDHENDL